jgi:MFS family permease
VLPLWPACTTAIVGSLWMVSHSHDGHHDRGRLPVRVGVRPTWPAWWAPRTIPVSGITIATILFASVVLMLLLGRDSDKIGAVAAIMIGAVVCCAAAVGGDNLQDLKAGYIVGATPWKQQLMLGDRRVLLRADHGAGAEPAGAVPMASACRSAGTSQFLVRPAGHADGSR